MNMTQLEMQEFERECKAYRVNHGANTLMPYKGRGDSWICKEVDDQQATLVKLGSSDQLIVSADDFKSEFFNYFVDESVFYFGNPDMKAALSSEIALQIAAMKTCLASDGQHVARLDS